MQQCGRDHDLSHLTCTSSRDLATSLAKSRSDIVADDDVRGVRLERGQTDVHSATRLGGLGGRWAQVRARRVRPRHRATSAAPKAGARRPSTNAPSTAGSDDTGRRVRHSRGGAETGSQGEEHDRRADDRARLRESRSGARLAKCTPPAERAQARVATQELDRQADDRALTANRGEAQLAEWCTPPAERAQARVARPGA
jgi:hypothetical protein